MQNHALPAFALVYQPLLLLLLFAVSPSIVYSYKSYSSKRYNVSLIKPPQRRRKQRRSVHLSLVSVKAFVGHHHAIFFFFLEDKFTLSSSFICFVCTSSRLPLVQWLLKWERQRRRRVFGKKAKTKVKNLN